MQVESRWIRTLSYFNSGIRKNSRIDCKLLSSGVLSILEESIVVVRATFWQFGDIAYRQIDPRTASTLLHAGADMVAK